MNQQNGSAATPFTYLFFLKKNMYGQNAITLVHINPEG